ncbi:MAG: PTS sugar transporter subunit IIA, partial [Pseudomonadota bacterium]
MDLEDLISEHSILPSLRIASKKQAIQALSEKAAEMTGVAEREIFDTLLQRERLGSTGVGQGVAIPHGKLPDIDRIYGLLARFEKPIDFDALDEQPVDIAFLLLAPEGA